MSFEQNYSGLDRALHRVAFSSPAVQLSAADVEELVYGRRFRSIAVRKPVFITSLPRAGTTLLLEILVRIPGLASHCYRDMPFVMAPLLWNTLSRSFRKAATLRERAHGDGMEVGYDSPEAFEEIMWRAFWPKKFKSDRIDLWSEDEDTDEFHQFFRAHMQKIISLRLGEQAGGGRYVSKNNANIARIGLLKRMFPDGRILVPFRDPFEQAASLLGQHKRFLDLHSQDTFSRQYMDDIGHLEFGALHRPICFNGVDQWLDRYRPDTNDYWVAYWVDTFRHVLEQKDHVVLVSYDRLGEQGDVALSAILRSLDIGEDVLRNTSHASLRSPRRYRDEDVQIQDDGLRSRARALHVELLKHSLN